MEQANRTLSRWKTKTSTLEQTVNQALDLAADIPRCYKEASGTIRRQLNQVFFKRFLVDEEGAVHAELSDEMSVLLAHDAVRRFEQGEKIPVLSGVGSIKDFLVELPGIEPGSPDP
jgi:hypothetical protein